MRFAAGQELFQLIDGAGEKYIRYGFHDLARTEYRGAHPSQVVTVEIYDMATPLGAFGQYSMLLSDERDPATMEPRATRHGNGGFLGGSQLVFWKAKYLVQVNFMDEDSGDETALAADAQRTLPAFATAVANAIPSDPQPAPTAPAALPTTGLVWGGLTRLADNVFGLANTGAAWVGHYRAPSGARYRLALFDSATEADARRLVATLRTPQAVGIPSLGDDAFSVTREQGEVTFVRSGSTLLALADALPTAPQSLAHAERIAALRAALAPAAPAAAH